jgi:hypothetical protein
MRDILTMNHEYVFMYRESAARAELKLVCITCSTEQMYEK